MHLRLDEWSRVLIAAAFAAALASAIGWMVGVVAGIVALVVLGVILWFAGRLGLRPLREGDLARTEMNLQDVLVRVGTIWGPPGRLTAKVWLVETHRSISADVPFGTLRRLTLKERFRIWLLS